jgi:hypothetical protein
MANPSDGGLCWHVVNLAAVAKPAILYDLGQLVLAL